MHAENNQIPDCDLAGLRVLIMDRSRINGEILNRYLSAWGMRCDTFVMEDEAIQAMQNAVNAGHPYHFVLVNYYIGDNDALQFGERIRSSSIQLNAIVCMFTSTPHLITSTNLLDMGFSAFFVKPYYPDLLKASFQVLWDARQKSMQLRLVTRHVIKGMLRAQAGGDAIQADMFFGTRVLVADDMKVNLVLIKKVLEKHGCVVFAAMNGREVVEMMSRERYDIVFMDCHMPEMDGFQATRCIRENSNTLSHKTAIVALTADAMVGDREKCLQAGMDDYLNKPFKPTQVTEILRKWVKKAA